MGPTEVPKAFTDTRRVTWGVQKSNSRSETFKDR
jgi:hypothetical protein